MVSVVRVLVGLLFLAAGVSKLRRRRSVRLTIERYRLLPSAVAGLAAILLGPAEVVVGAGLALSAAFTSVELAWFGAEALLVFFSLAIALALARGLDIPCGCGLLLGDHAITKTVLARNLALIGVLWLVK